ncbi:MAG: branched-chain amino acid ABC transporter permease [Deltaproteobacteria bacterium]|nr:branched-chain amino acid ABC transporter permease [Deltaproteobacteria bacterium]
MNAKTLTFIHYFILVIILLIILPLIFKDTQFQHILIMIMLFSTASQAWNILGGYAGQVSFGHACFFGIGAYGSLALLNNWGLTPWLGMLIGGLVSVGLAVLIGIPVFKLSGHYFAISTLAIAEVVRELFSSWDWVDGPIGLDAPVLEPSLHNFMFYQTKIPYNFIVLSFFITIMLVTRWIERSRMGYYLKAIRQSPDAAEGIGVSISRYKLYALMISAFFTAMCGSFYAQYNLHIEPATVMSIDISIKIVLIAVLGGAGSIWGPLFGSIILLPLSEYTRIWLGGTGMGIDLIIFGSLIMLISVFRPDGIVGILKMFGIETKES